jgi:hypothetical protein
MNRPQIPGRLGGLQPVRAPADLRQRAIAAARAALRRQPERTDPWSRIRCSRGLRWAWATAVAVLVVGHLVLSISPRNSGGAPPFDRQRVAEVGPEVEPLVRLSRIKALSVVDRSTPTTRRDATLENPS